MMHHGKTYKGDIGISLSTRGIYFVISKLDGGINFDFSSVGQFLNCATYWQLNLGPLDLMWLKGKEVL